MNVYNMKIKQMELTKELGVQQKKPMKQTSQDIFFLYIKSQIYILCFIYWANTYSGYHEIGTCSYDGQVFLQILQWGSLGCVILNAFGMMKGMLTKTFQPFMLGFIYLLNILLYIICLIDMFYSANYNQIECVGVQYMQKVFFLFSTKTQLESIMIFIFSHRFAQLQLNTCSNVCFVLILLFTPNVLACDPRGVIIFYSILIFHPLVTCLTFIFNVLISFSARLKVKLEKTIQWLFLIAIIGNIGIISYMSIACGLQTTFPITFACAHIAITTRSYILIGPLLIFVNLYGFKLLAKRTLEEQKAKEQLTAHDKEEELEEENKQKQINKDHQIQSSSSIYQPQMNFSQRRKEMQMMRESQLSHYDESLNKQMKISDHQLKYNRFHDEN